jgi:hypothetical protein
VEQNFAMISKDTKMHQTSSMKQSISHIHQNLFIWLKVCSSLLFNHQVITIKKIL